MYLGSTGMNWSCSYNNVVNCVGARSVLVVVVVVVQFTHTFFLFPFLS